MCFEKYIGRMGKKNYIKLKTARRYLFSILFRKISYCCEELRDSMIKNLVLIEMLQGIINDIKPRIEKKLKKKKEDIKNI